MTRTIRRFALAAAASFPILLTSAASAAVVAIDFNDVATGQLQGKAGGEGFADGSTWTANTTLVQVVADDLAPPASTHYNLTQDGSGQKVRGTHTDDRVVNRPLATPLGGEIWGSFVINVGDAAGKAGLGFNNPQLTNTSFVATQSIVREGADIVYYTGLTERARLAGAANLGESALVLFRIVYDTADPRKGFSAWVNPNLLEALPEPDLFSEIIGNGNIGSLTVGGRRGGEIDMIRLSSDADAFTDVTGQLFIPEPGSLGMVGLSLLLLVRSR